MTAHAGATAPLPSPDPLPPGILRAALAARAALLELLRRTADLVAPRDCPCGAEGDWLCPDCAALLHGGCARVEDGCDALQVLAAARIRAGTTAEGVELPAGVDHRPVMPVLALGEYTAGLQSLVLAWKNGGRAHLTAPIAEGLAPAVALLAGAAGERTGGGGGHGRRRSDGAADPPPVELVPVPSRRAARLRRGEDHTAELARALEREGAGTALLLRSRPTTAQEGRGRRGRRERRIELALSRRRERPGALRGRRLVIVDDVVTTGATLRAMHDALVAEGAEVLGAVVVAASRLPSPPDVR
ncbi:amidophosphoribosyltransferase [Brachybacterium sp. SGAir0954]|uniref:ComF family protein n=1 Tax=Brachybacterium sp. SGAir0954 TaxID=2571029 RepID=UPI0010CD239C|nr:phosphoribosyltransferase family protein [Brachybacterium sp. SGAir0954]QCR53634.1 amidophosphoribosyltransferase [Brachybacterium sp. SGAir0954]